MLPLKGTPRGTAKLRLGELLVKAGVITDSQLKTALQEQRQWGGKLGDILVRMRYLSEDIFVRALSKQMGLPRADFNASIPLEALAKIPAEVAEEYEIVPVGLLDDGKTLVIATSDPLNVTVIDYVRSIARIRVVAHIAGPTAIRSAIARLYQGEDMRVGADSEMRVLSNSEDEGPTARPPQPPPTGTHPSMQALRPDQPSASGPFLPPPNGYLPSAYGPSPMPGPSPAMPFAPPQDGRVQQAVEDSQRREVAALKALVELLVQKGVISLEEYLARLKR